MKILVKSDVYNMCNRIKKFDPAYRLVFNSYSNRYEVYSTRLVGSIEVISGVVLSYVCGLPYSELDERIIKYLYDTSVENMDDIINQIDMQNKQIEHKNERDLTNKSIIAFENKLRQLT